MDEDQDRLIEWEIYAMQEGLTEEELDQLINDTWLDNSLLRGDLD